GPMWMTLLLIKLHICYSEPRVEDVEGRDYQHKGWVSVELMKTLLPSSNYQFYICGPAPMMNSLTEDLEAWGIPESDVHYEAFGPATVKRVSHQQTIDKETVEVNFARSDKTINWSPLDGTLLELAEANGIIMDSGCRAGNCGTCLTAIRNGEVDYLNDPGVEPEAGSCLTCIATPKTALELDA
ncbi:MAG: 2Fe-2S iron-sulfur cluster-binding protein, partial [Pseudomonadota bacterium]